MRTLKKSLVVYIKKIIVHNKYKAKAIKARGLTKPIFIPDHLMSLYNTLIPTI